MRKHLRGPGQATYDFDGVRPGLLVVKKGGPAGQTLPSLASLLFAHAIKHMLCFGTSFLCAEKGGKDAGSFVGFHEEKTGGSVITRTNHTIRAAAQDRIPIERFLSDKIMTTQTPGGLGPPCCMGVGSKDSVPADFHEEKIGTFSGSPGAKLPAAFLLPFVAEDKRKWPRSR